MVASPLLSTLRLGQHTPTIVMTYSKLAGVGVGIAATFFILQRLRKEVAPFFSSRELAKLDLGGEWFS